MWEKVIDMGMPEGTIYASGRYLYVSTTDGMYRMFIG
ncbi:hypothetical protein LCGC14_0927090 [marine sediment metagenome]|uniref:SMP-30/Gluconolactonase/LRE-like region domain-containing protein n=1 Tax=marine sediment metagenome TaxID=412755 RepID=A0A0F9RVU8_9ZZZZ